MMRAGWMALSLVLLSGAAFASAAGNADDVLGELQRGIDRAQANDCAGAVPVLKGAVESPAFGQLTAQQQYIAERVLAGCAFDIRDYSTSVRMSRAATAGQQAEKTDWYLRTLASWASKDKDDASQSLLRLVAWPDMVSGLKMQTLYSVLDDVAGTPEGDARNLKIVKALYDANWRPTEEPAVYADGLWLRLARLELKAGDVAAARQVAAVITSSECIIEIRSDKLFDPVVAAEPGHYDIAKFFTADAARRKAKMAKTAGKLEPVVAYATILYQLDRPDEVLAVIDKALAKVKAGQKFEDADDELNWLYNERSHALMALGRVDEALATMESGSHVGEHGHNVSQTINLADVYYSLGRPQDAVKVLADFDPNHASPYGVMAAEEARACAYAQLGDQAKLAKSLAFTRAHADDAPGVAVQILLCAGQEDEAAAMALHYLNDEQKRDRILQCLHTDLAPAKAPDMPFDRLMRARWEALAKRPEIVAAVERFGHILHVPVVLLH